MSEYTPFPAFTGWAGSFDPTASDAYARRLDERRATVTAAQLDRAVEIATRYAAVDTGAIEGLYQTTRAFTCTIATQSATWEAALRQHGDHVARSIQDALNGYGYVLDAATQQSVVSEMWIRQLHEVLCASQETYTVYTAAGPQRQALPKGVYKSLPNSPTNAETGRVHYYAPVDDTAPEMARLIGELRSDAFLAAHPVVQAAYAHYAYVCVHPFADGNGRVARALASVYLYRRPGVPLVVFADQKDAYLDALEAADSQQSSAFVSFVAERTMDAVDLVLGSLRSGPPSVEEAVTALRREVGNGDDLTPAEVDALSYRLTDVVNERLAETVRSVDQTAGLIFTVRGRSDVQATAPVGYRSGDLRDIALETEYRSGVRVGRDVRVRVWVSAAAEDLHFLVAAEDRVDPLEVRVRDIHPRATQVLEIKVMDWVEELVATEIDLLRRQIEVSTP